MKPYWQGVFPAVTTQLKKDQSLDLDATTRHVEVLLESAVTGVIMLGSLGENQSLAPQEKRTVV
jgi:4-hydroxy-tetrahydrodipicolinate synthase